MEYLNYGVVEERGWSLHKECAFEKASEAGLDEDDHGTLEVFEDKSILDAAEREGLSWSLKCVEGRCGRCSAVVVDGEVDMDDGQEFLTREEVQSKDICLPCVSKPETNASLVYGVQELDYLENRVK